MELATRSPRKLAQTILKLYAKIACAQTLFWLIVRMVMRARRLRLLQHIPVHRGPSVPLIGILPELLKNRKRRNHFFDDLTRGLPVAKLKGPFWDEEKLWVLVRDPLLVRHVLKDGFDDFTKPDKHTDWLAKLMQEFLGNGIFTLRHGRNQPGEEALWMHQRKIAANIFTRRNFNTNMAEVFTAKARHLRKCLEPGKPIDMQLLFFNFTMDSILKIFFNEECNTVAGKANEFGTAFDNAHRGFFKYHLSSAPALTVFSLLPWPWGGLNGICIRVFGRFHPLYRDFKSNVAKLNAECDRMIGECRSDPLLMQRRDLLALFMQAVEENGMPRSEQTTYLRDVVMNFVIAGRDTTACTLSWMFYILATNPDVHQRVSEEVARCLPAGKEPSLQDLHHSNMPLLHALLYETLRMYPAVPLDVKEAAVDTTLPGGFKVNKGVKVMGRDSEKWPQPEQVQLERWIPFKQPSPHEFPVFQAGPRVCLGMDMSIFEAKLVAAMLLQEFDFSIVPGEESKIHYSNTLTMSVCNSKDQDSHNLWLVPQRRDPTEAGIQTDAPIAGCSF